MSETPDRPSLPPSIERLVSDLPESCREEARAWLAAFCCYQPKVFAVVIGPGSPRKVGMPHWEDPCNG